jgi:hypothetical protein
MQEQGLHVTPSKGKEKKSDRMLVSVDLRRI